MKALRYLVPLVALVSLLVGADAFAACKATSATTQDCPVNLTWQDNSSGTGQETFFDVYFRVGTTGTFAKVGSVGPDVVNFAHVATGVGGGVQICYEVQAGNTAGLSPFSNIACQTTPAIVFVSVPSAPSNLVAQ